MISQISLAVKYLNFPEKTEVFPAPLGLVPEALR
jgi:hypothetical protein